MFVILETSPPQIYEYYEASKMATHDVAQQKLRRFLATSSVKSEVLSMLMSQVS